MKCVRSLGSLLLAILISAPVLLPAQQDGGLDHALNAAALRRRAEAAQTEARGWARRHGAPMRLALPNDGVAALAELQNGIPLYRKTLSANAAISTATNLVQGAPYALDGDGLIAAIWDAGGARTTHQEFTARSSIMDSAPIDAHSTYVAGIVGSAGIVAAARGMATAVTLHSYDWDDDDAEMLAAGAAVAGDPGKSYVSNHSYGDASGWESGSYSGNSGLHFFGEWGSLPLAESDLFGQYSEKAAIWDEICYLRPYFLPVRAISNDRDDAVPSNGQTFYRLNWTGSEYVWVSDTYNSALHPAADGIVNGGFDTCPTFAGAKNILTVGAVNDAVIAGSRDLGAATMSAFSGWGPTDDGRIKPDLVGNGVVVYSALSATDASYPSGAGSNGTSFSSPNIAGSAILLQQYYEQLFGTSMRASTLKALILHTADDLTAGAARPGPDYSTGWGLMNTQSAADLIKLQSDNSGDRHIFESTLQQLGTEIFVYMSDGSSPLRVTICWTDPAGSAQTGVDNRTRVLVNDLDLRVMGPDETIFYPYLLDVENPSFAAATGDNLVDNIEQVYIASPLAGEYTVQITHKGTLANGVQQFALVVTGLTGGFSGVKSWDAFQ